MTLGKNDLVMGRDNGAMDVTVTQTGGVPANATTDKALAIRGGNEKGAGIIRRRVNVWAGARGGR